MPLIELNSVLGDGGAEGSSCVTMSSIPFRKLSLVVDAIGLNKTLNVTQRCVEPVSQLVHEGEVTSLRCLHLEEGWLARSGDGCLCKSALKTLSKQHIRIL